MPITHDRSSSSFPHEMLEPLDMVNETLRALLTTMMHGVRGTDGYWQIVGEQKEKTHDGQAWLAVRAYLLQYAIEGLSQPDVISQTEESLPLANERCKTLLRLLHGVIHGERGTAIYWDIVGEQAEKTQEGKAWLLARACLERWAADDLSQPDVRSA